jgi:hypothetical protein
MVSAICPECHILLVEARNAEEVNLAAAEDEAAALRATEISDSYYEPAAVHSAEVREAYEHRGIPTAAAAGDDGFGAAFPAASPGVIAVGGTTLEHTGLGEWNESVWYSGHPGEGSGTGAGCSNEPKPAWQQDLGCPFRTLNDVAAVADPNSPVSVYDSFQTKSPWLLMGGTSVATPIVAAAMALSTPYTRSFEGAEGLYLAARDAANEFYDVVSGSDGTCESSYLCSAGPGYDGPTGLGSLRGVPALAAPEVLEELPAEISGAKASVAATINPHGAALQTCEFEYGTTSSYGASVACQRLPPSSIHEAVTVSASLQGLAAGTYHSRAVLTFPGGSATGPDRIFEVRGAGVLEGGGPPESPGSSVATLTNRTAEQGPAARTAAAGATFAGALRLLGDGRIAVPLSCPTRASPCRGEISIRAATAGAGAEGGGLSAILYAAGGFAIAPGHRATILLTLRASARRRLARTHRLHAHATVATRRAGAPAQVQRITATIRAAVSRR